MTCWACDRADKNRVSGYFQAGCPACNVRHIARLPRHHRVAAYRAAQAQPGRATSPPFRVAAYRAAQAAGRDVLELQTAARAQYEIDKRDGVAS